MPRIKGQRLLKYVDQAVCSTATVLYDTIQFFNKHRPGAPFTPKWSDKPLLKSWQKTKPPLGWPRETDSLCPDRKSTRLNSSHLGISYAVFCLKQKKQI